MCSLVQHTNPFSADAPTHSTSGRRGGVGVPRRYLYHNFMTYEECDVRRTRHVVRPWLCEQQHTTLIHPGETDGWAAVALSSTS
jgi:hypothetical protein